MKKLEEVKYFITEDSIVLYWRKPCYETGYYEILLDGNVQGKTEQTFYKIEDLCPDTSYQVEIRCCCAEAVLQIVTGKRRKRLDVTKAPYEACGDGKQLNTEVLQRAIEDCGADGCVYFPAGIFAFA